MLYLALAVACSLTIGMIFKAAALRGLDRMALLTMNYGVAALLALALLITSEHVGALQMPPLLVVLGLVLGVLFIGGFFLLSYATELAGMSLALAVMRLSVVIPVVVAWGVWAEVPTEQQQVGLALACAAFVVMARPGKKASDGAAGKVFLVLGALFLAGGLVDVLLKAFDVHFGAEHSSAGFLLLIFSTACVLGSARVLLRGQARQRWPPATVVLWGSALGLVNYGSTAFLLAAVARLDAPTVFPLNNVGIVLGGALLGHLVWQEPLARRTWLGLGLAAVALAFLGRGGG